MSEAHTYAVLPLVGGQGWAKAHPEFGSSVNPITTRGAYYAQRITASSLGFENLAAALVLHFFNLHKINT